jgi:hypothetical protein
MKTWNQQEINDFLKAVAADPKLAAKYANVVRLMLLSINARQTADEQASKRTGHSNGKGFNKFDASFLGDVAAKTADNPKAFTPGRSKAVAKALIKYSRQLADIAVEKLERKAIQAA